MRNDYIADIREHYIKFKSNKTRKITTYKSHNCPLYLRHQKINNFISKYFINSIFAKGYVKGLSIYHNANAHMYNDYFIKYDIKDFFSNISHSILIDKLYYELNKISSNTINKSECIQIIEDCSVQSRGLPLGFTTSPILSNVYLKEFDCILYGKLKQLNISSVIYTRYSDDLTISFKTNETERQIDIEEQIKTILEKQLHKYSLKLNERKIKYYNLNISNHVKITGINITKDNTNYRSLTVGRKTKNQLFWDAINYYKNKSTKNSIQQEQIVKYLKGMQSFILSIEKKGYDDQFSDKMIQMLSNLGFKSLKDLIDSL